MAKNKMKIEFLSKSENESFARVAVAAFASQLDPTIDEISDIKTAVSEAVTNAIIHGYENKEEIVTLECEIDEDILILSVHDTGCGIEDVELSRQPLYTSKEDMERSGMGFTVMESFMDEVEVESKKGVGTKVKMVKKFKSLGIE